MFRLSLIIIFQFLSLLSYGQQTKSGDSPHGEALLIDCKACHTTSGWKVFQESMTFSHDSTQFVLEGQHLHTDCIACHPSLIFDEARSDCITCHTDIHQETVGMDCARCHDSQNWLVNNISIIHENASFPLDGVHFGLDCNQCHNSATELTFYPILNECVACHQTDFDNTSDPDHNAAEYSINCAECHSLTSFDWSADNYNHDFFPLTKGHDHQECSACHEDNNYATLPTDCFACHQEEFDNSRNPNHISGNFSLNCTDCHTTDPEWKPAEYLEHDDNYFPIYKGEHAGEWDDCKECHQLADDFNQFSCTHCHEHDRNSMNDEHSEVEGYVYEDRACYACHPNGDSHTIFNHDMSNFPLTGVHRMVECKDCHSDGYSGTPGDCFACHEQDYNNSENPDHKELNLSNDCKQCHTTDPDWVPATFDIHDDYYPLNGAHQLIGNDCISCHNGDYTNTTNDCIGCHQTEFENTSNPPHASLQFSQDCSTCHTETSWEPSTFEHDMQYFPVFSGAHEGEWESCNECHSNADNYMIFSCIDCHAHNKNDADDQHISVNAYSYESQACFACHPTGTADDVFDHNLTAFPLTGSHAQADCISCHIEGYIGTPTDCFSCHELDFNASVNPDHQSLGLSFDCNECHTTEPDWKPASFDMHDDFYPLNGAHKLISTDCASCHQGDYKNTPNTCYACHQQDFESTLDPSHLDLQFSTDCASCHTEDQWTPSTFDHDGMYFPIYSGEHHGEWDQCTDCHSVLNNYSVFSCTNCHMNPETDQGHLIIGGYVYEDQACLACHPTGSANDGFDHNQTAFPLTGAHNSADCIECHINGYENTPTDCFACHEIDFNQSTNPNHQQIGLSNACSNCHNTDPGWSPALFDVHNDYFELTGAHIPISSDCTACHNGNYNNTPNDCAGCHTPDYNQSSNPDHQQLGLSTDCATCHSTDPNWVPASFDVHNDFYMLNGAHALIANDCATCHNGDYNNTPNTCFACHEQNYNESTEPNHSDAQFSTDCASCHTEDQWTPSTFDHDGMYFPIYSGEHDGEWSQCTDCHSVEENYSIFSCTNCHVNPETDEEHVTVGGYAYEDQACLACHPTGSADDSFDHNNTGFPLTGAHSIIDCAQCHENGYSNTSAECVSCHLPDYDAAVNPNHGELGLSTECVSCHTTDPGWTPALFDIHSNYFELTGAHITIASDCGACHNGDYNNTPNDCAGCHTPDYNQSSNPDHQLLGLSTDCAACHSTDPDWVPASFDVHNDFYMLNGAHALIANDCASCHNGDYNNTPNTCFACHEQNYNEASNPNHIDAQFSTDCANCHTEDQWTPSTFDHDGMYFPIYSGEHNGEWAQCTDCHTLTTNYAVFSCTNCHVNPETDDEHMNVGGYVYEDQACLACHPTGSADDSFDHNNTGFPLTGAHSIIGCSQCHENGYSGTPSECMDCHMPDYDTAVNPNHDELGISTECVSCHTTEPGWSPALFDIHENYFELTGAHILIASDCAACHNGDYNNTPIDCAGCHTPDYNQSSNPDHQQLGISTDCATCHSTDPGWSPATFDIHENYYPFTGAHIPIASDCAACHTGDYTNTPNDCAGCHTPDYNQSSNPDHQQLGLSTDCENCHSTDAGWNPATFDLHDNYYSFTGAHIPIANDCAACHNGDYNNTPTDCAGCHTTDYNQSNNPDHQQIGLSTDCESCHSTEPGWTPAIFPVHDDYYPLIGAHLQVASDCFGCHSGDYNNTPNDCSGCHLTDYNQASEPDHQQLDLSLDCANCHTTDPDWTPASFPVHDEYYPLIGAHAIIASDCAACHTNGYNNTPNDCFSCHETAYNNTNDPNHLAAQFPTDCQACHSETAWIPATFDHDGMYFPIYSGKHEEEWNQCSDCHNVANDYSIFDCLSCHTNPQTDEDHSEVDGYSYDSPSCFACHPTGDD